MSEGTPDRVSFSYGMKLNMGNYESASFQISLSSDLKEGETRGVAYVRVKKFVETVAEKKLDEFAKVREAKQEKEAHF